jgi:PAS domain-containing protein
MNAPLPANEAKRLAALDAMGVMDTPTETTFDELAWLAAHACGSRFAQINFVHSSRVWTKANIGSAETEERRNISPCAYVVSSGDLVVIPDTYEDERTKLSPMVIQGPRIRFYAGVPLLAEGGEAIGTVCVMDTDPHKMTVSQGGALWAISRQIMANLGSRRSLQHQAHSAIADPDVEERARTHDRRISAMVEQVPAVMWTTDTDLRFTLTLGSVSSAFHLKPSEVMGSSLQEYFGIDDDAFPPIAAHLAVLRGEAAGPLRWSGWGRTLEVRIEPLLSPDGEVIGCLGVGLDIGDRIEIDRAAARLQQDFLALALATARPTAVDGHGMEDSGGTATLQGTLGGDAAGLLDRIRRHTA